MNLFSMGFRIGSQAIIEMGRVAGRMPGRVGGRVEGTSGEASCVASGGASGAIAQGTVRLGKQN
jgi:hypothetical protein